MLHYDVMLHFPAVYHDFANLLNFVTRFYNEEIRTSQKETLHHHLDRELWSEEDDLSWWLRSTGWIVLYTLDSKVFVDRTLGCDGQPNFAAQDQYAATLGLLNLAARYGSSETLSTIDTWAKGGNAEQRRAQKDFVMSQESGLAPSRNSEAIGVADFVGLMPI